MRRLNREWLGHDWPTDVLAFGLPGPDGAVTGDVYICPAVARAEAEARGLTPGEELVRLVIHGTLHVLGHDHPEGAGRTRSAMWRRQERYVKALA
jgi:probable rRNA maturation factor